MARNRREKRLPIALVGCEFHGVQPIRSELMDEENGDVSVMFRAGSWSSEWFDGESQYSPTSWSPNESSALASMLIASFCGPSVPNTTGRYSFARHRNDRRQRCLWICVGENHLGGRE
jgi:hypothetical protein